MPAANCFRHQRYGDAPTPAPYELLRPAPPDPPGSLEFARRWRVVGEQLRAARVGAIYLVHGTFAGPDMLGLWSELARLLPGLAERGRGWTKWLVDAAMGEVGNFTAAHAAQLQEWMAVHARAEIPVRRWCWSGENHHLARADGAVRLIDELARRGLSAGQRVLLVGHSHAGNVFAIASNLCSGRRGEAPWHADNVARFFEAGSAYYRSPLTGYIDQPHWARVRELLLAPAWALEGVRIDVATLGTPIRYGWDTAGCDALVHLMNHRPYAPWPPHVAPFPPNWDHVFAGCGGDFVQQAAVPGTDFPAALFSYRAVLANARLGALLQHGVPSGAIAEYLRAGRRVADDGTTLLVDYGPPAARHPLGHLWGHAVYTRRKWALFQLEQIVRLAYDSA